MIKALKHPGFLKYFSNTSWLLVERVLRMVVSLFIGIYVARYLGPEHYGVLNYTLSFVWLFSALASLGLDDIFIRELVKNPENRKELLGTVFWLKISGSFIMIVIILAILPFLSNNQRTEWMIILIALGFFFQANNVIDYYFQSQVQSKYSVKAQTGQLILASIFKIFLIWNKAELIWFAFALMLDQLIVAVLFVITYRWKVEWLPIFSFKWNQAKKLLKDSWPLMFAGIVVSVYMKIDQVMLKEMLDNKAVGVYAAAVKLCEAWYFVPTAVMASLFPAVVESRKKSKKIYEERIQKLYDVMVWGAVAVALPTTLLAEWLILLLFGANFEEAADVLRVYIWAGVFVSLGVASSKWLVVEKLERYSFYRTVMGATLNVGCNLWLIPIYGIKGAAYATLISYGTAAYGSMLCFPKVRKNFWIATNSLNPFGTFRRTFL